MHKLIVTRSDDNIKEMTEITHPLLIKYAEKCNAGFDVISDSKDLHPHYRILMLYQYFEAYDRILCLDSDMLIRADCPDLFNLVSVDTIGTVYEDKGSRQPDRRNRIAKVQKQRKSIDWTEGYINTGCIVFSKIHRNIFDVKKEDLYMDLGYDDVELGYQIQMNKYKVMDLGYKFNHMSMFSEQWHGNKSRFDSYIIHYAGNGFHPFIDRLDQIKQDYLVMKKYGLV